MSDKSSYRLGAPCGFILKPPKSQTLLESAVDGDVDIASAAIVVRLVGLIPFAPERVKCVAGALKRTFSCPTELFGALA
ncbi:MAG TPA: hypothetical protein VE596_10085 [Gaiellaceae bacterium]|jgi:hypothetical protein|nr:hypothetical protein [Gaiellaceae bacterium]